MYLDGILALVLQHYQTALWRRYFLLTLLLKHPFSAISPSPLPQKMPGLEWESGGGPSTVISPAFQSFSFNPT